MSSHAGADEPREVVQLAGIALGASAPASGASGVGQQMTSEGSHAPVPANVVSVSGEYAAVIVPSGARSSSRIRSEPAS